MTAKTQRNWHLCKYYKVYEDYIKLVTELAENTKKHRKTKKTSFPKESIEYADFFKQVLNRIMTRLE